MIDPTMIHVGSLVKLELRKQGYSVTWLARQLHKERSGVYKMLSRKSLDISTLMMVSVVLNHDFFADISKMLQRYTTLMKHF
ncbi:MAG: XRE family transcriptional regulator [Bacteroidales bacterium]|nr:XRE family transcriptional regulator [Bacteroidales bacterium]